MGLETKESSGPVRRFPAGFWTSFNQWWHSEFARQGQRPNSKSINRWHANNAVKLWGGNAVSYAETQRHANRMKCRRTGAFAVQRNGDADDEDDQDDGGQDASQQDPLRDSSSGRLSAAPSTTSARTPPATSTLHTAASSGQLTDMLPPASQPQTQPAPPHTALQATGSGDFAAPSDLPGTLAGGYVDIDHPAPAAAHNPPPPPPPPQPLQIQGQQQRQQSLPPQQQQQQQASWMHPDPIHLTDTPRQACSPPLPSHPCHWYQSPQQQDSQHHGMLQHRPQGQGQGHTEGGTDAPAAASVAGFAWDSAVSYSNPGPNPIPTPKLHTGGSTNWQPPVQALDAPPNQQVSNIPPSAATTAAAVVAAGLHSRAGSGVFSEAGLLGRKAGAGAGEAGGALKRTRSMGPVEEGCMAGSGSMQEPCRVASPHPTSSSGGGCDRKAACVRAQEQQRQVSSSVAAAAAAADAASNPTVAAAAVATTSLHMPQQIKHVHPQLTSPAARDAAALLLVAYRVGDAPPLLLHVTDPRVAPVWLQRVSHELDSLISNSDLLQAGCNADTGGCALGYTAFALQRPGLQSFGARQQGHQALFANGQQRRPRFLDATEQLTLPPPQPKRVGGGALLLRSRSEGNGTAYRGGYLAAAGGPGSVGMGLGMQGGLERLASRHGFGAVGGSGGCGGGGCMVSSAVSPCNAPLGLGTGNRVLAAPAATREDAGCGLGLGSDWGSGFGMLGCGGPGGGDLMAHMYGSSSGNANTIGSSCMGMSSRDVAASEGGGAHAIMRPDAAFWPSQMAMAAAGGGGSNADASAGMVTTTNRISAGNNVAISSFGVTNIGGDGSGCGGGSGGFAVAGGLVGFTSAIDNMPFEALMC